jgi:hypothetical protein
VTEAQLRAERVRRQRLDRQGGGAPGEIVRALLAVQAQDARAARLALRARGPGFAVSDVDADDGLVVAWLLRGTLHLVAREDWPWLLGLTAPARMSTSARRLGQEGVTPDAADRAVGVIGRALGDEGPLARPELGERLERAGIRTAGQALPHLLMRAALLGTVVIRGDGRFERAQPPGPLEDRDGALAELARRWLAAHGPATARDLAAWSGLPLRDARAGLRALELSELGGELVDLAAAPRDAAPPAAGPRLLPAFDPYLLGWRDRAFAVAPAFAKRVYPGGGMVRAVAAIDGLAAGTWTAPRGRIAVEWFEAAEDDRFAGEVADVERFLSG